MSTVELKADVQRLKSELRKARLALGKERRARKRLAQALDFGILGKNWTPDEQVVRMYGWVYAWSFPLRCHLDKLLKARAPLTPDVRDKVTELFYAIIAQLVTLGRYGVKLPLDPRPVDGAAFVRKMQRTFMKVYPPCVICGEERITHECHIIPRAEGGPLHRDNFIDLCPLHHHLLDHNRLTSKEWERLMKTIARRMDAARVYAEKVRFPKLQAYWATNDSG